MNLIIFSRNHFTHYLIPVVEILSQSSSNCLHEIDATCTPHKARRTRDIVGPHLAQLGLWTCRVACLCPGQAGPPPALATGLTLIPWAGFHLNSWGPLVKMGGW